MLQLLQYQSNDLKDSILGQIVTFFGGFAWFLLSLKIALNMNNVGQLVNKWFLLYCRASMPN